MNDTEQSPAIADAPEVPAPAAPPQDTEPAPWWLWFLSGRVVVIVLFAGLLVLKEMRIHSLEKLRDAQRQLIEKQREFEGQQLAGIKLRDGLIEALKEREKILGESMASGIQAEVAKLLLEELRKRQMNQRSDLQ